LARCWLRYLICLDELLVHRLKLVDHAVATPFRINREIVPLEKTGDSDGSALSMQVRTI
jgi:hypothetical protein